MGKETEKDTKQQDIAKPVVKAAGITKTTDSALVDINKLANAYGLPGWEKAGLFKASGWAQGKKVADSEFKQALDKFRKRKLGGGKIK